MYISCKYNINTQTIDRLSFKKIVSEIAVNRWHNSSVISIVSEYHHSCEWVGGFCRQFACGLEDVGQRTRFNRLSRSLKGKSLSGRRTISCRQIQSLQYVEEILLTKIRRCGDDNNDRPKSKAVAKIFVRGGVDLPCPYPFSFFLFLFPLSFHFFFPFLFLLFSPLEAGLLKSS